MLVSFESLIVLLWWANTVSSQMTSIATTWPATKFIGYYVAPDSTEALLAGNSWVTSGTYAGDCATSGKCVIATRCVGDTLYYDNDSSTKCGAATCVKMTIFAASPNITPSAYNYRCRSNWLANTVYRELAAATTSSSLTTSSASSPSPTGQSSTPSNTNVSTSATSTPESAPASKVWIAGAVIGPIVGIALIAAALFWRRRRSNKNNAENLGYDTGHLQDYPEYQLVQQQVAEKHSIVRPAELAHEPQPSELPTTHY
ncbi:hypothetical protein M3J09_008755 [Ascochyta lentis]